MRVDKLLMLGVGALGLYAVYRLTQTSAASQLPDGQPKQPRPTPVPILEGPLPDAPGVIPPAPASLDLVQGSPLHLQPGRWYHGRLETGPGPFSPSATREQLRSALVAMGFDGNPFRPEQQPHVFMTPQEAAQDIFQAFALANPGRGTRWFRARWPLVLEGPQPLPSRPSFTTMTSIRSHPRAPTWPAAPRAS